MAYSCFPFLTRYKGDSTKYLKAIKLNGSKGITGTKIESLQFPDYKSGTNVNTIATERKIPAKPPDKMRRDSFPLYFEGSS